MSIGQPLLAVRLLTYNHEKYIERSIRGALNQITDFHYVIVIGEDASTDRTADICQKLEKEFPDKIKLRCNPSNNLAVNSATNWEICRESGARYVALLEGDDYWTDQYKLQRQVDFLRQNPSYSLSYHQITTEISDETIHDYQYPEIAGDALTLEKAVFQHYIPTASLVFDFDKFYIPDWLFHEKIKSADIVFSLTLLLSGPGHYIREPMAVYRRHSGSITQSKVIKEQISVLTNYALIFENLDKDSGGKYRHLFKQRILPHRNGIMWMSLKKGDLLSAFSSFFVIMKYDPLYLVKRMFSKLKTS